MRQRLKYVIWMLTAVAALIAIPTFAYSGPEDGPAINAVDPYLFENPDTGDSSVTRPAGR